MWIIAGDNYAMQVFLSTFPLLSEAREGKNLYQITHGRGSSGLAGGVLERKLSSFNVL